MVKTLTTVEVGPDAEDAAVRLAQARQVRKMWEDTEKEAKKDLDKALEGADEADVYITGAIEIKVTNNKGQGRLSTDKLLDQGVSPEIIANATTRTPYKTVTVKERK